MAWDFFILSQKWKLIHGIFMKKSRICFFLFIILSFGDLWHKLWIFHIDIQHFQCWQIPDFGILKFFKACLKREKKSSANSKNQHRNLVAFWFWSLYHLVWNMVLTYLGAFNMRSLFWRVQNFYILIKLHFTIS